MRRSMSFVPFVLALAAGCAIHEPTATPTENAGTATAPIATVRSAEILPPTAEAVPTAAADATPEAVRSIDDFEGAQTAWTVCTDPECADSSAVSVGLTADHASQGKQALQLNFEKNSRPKAVFYLQRPLDLSAGRAVRFDVYNPGTIDGVGFALTTGADSIWYESDRVSVAPGKIIPLAFDLAAGTYKTAATNWEFRAHLADLNAVVRLSIVIYPKTSGAVFLDNLYLSNAF
jgi:hypothetical protein